MNYICYGQYSMAESVEDAPLPVFLSTFDVTEQESAIQINWTVASELNILGYILESKSLTDKDFKIISSYKNNPDLRSEGNSSIEKNYTFTDRNAAIGRVDYKLLSAELNGQNRLIAEKSIHHLNENIPNALDLQVYPNPFNLSCSVKFNLSKPGLVTLNVYDIKGQLYKTITKNFSTSGGKRVPITLKNAASGLYLLNLATTKQAKNIKIILIK
jgi:hypothetical protein